MEEKKGKKLYLRSVKAAVVTLLIICMAAVPVLGSVLLNVLDNSGVNYSDLQENTPYEETQACGWRMFSEMHSISQDWNKVLYFEKDGVLDKDALVDIQNFQRGILDENEINKNTAYSLAQLDIMLSRTYDYDGDNTISRLEQMLNEADSYSSEADYDVYNMPEGYTEGAVSPALSERFQYLYKNGKRLELTLPKSGVALADYALQNPDTVSLYELYRQLLDILVEYRSYCNYIVQEEAYWADTNLCYWVYDKDSTRVFSNGMSENITPKNCEETAKRLAADNKTAFFMERKNGIITKVSGNTDTGCIKALTEAYRSRPLFGSNEIALVMIDSTYPVSDSLREAHIAYTQYVPLFIPCLIAFFVSLLLTLILLVIVTVQAGHTSEDEKIRLIKLDRLPTELEIGCAMAAGCACIAALEWALYVCLNEKTVFLLVPGFTGAVAAAILLCFYLSFVRRIKVHNLWEGSLLRFIVKTCREIYDARRTSGKLMIIFGAFVFWHIFLIGAFGAFGAFLCLIIDVLCLLLLMRETAGRQVIKDGLQQITEGNMDFKINVENLRGDNLQMAESINGLGNGLQAAVEKSMKSERLKADLITNVSHDIKTPLTSIINYVDLLKRENIEDPKIKGYIDILDSKSQRLKQLTEDLVEASKISSGNVSLEFSRMNLKELIQQTNGEFAERFGNKELDLICRLPEEPLLIYADGRRVWRILENLYVNVAKYAMPRTRVYVDAWIENNRVFFTMKNISEHTLNINADELTERFIRGDISRSTEGSGLGLSIAKNLTQIQKGSFDVYLDGDLFKVTISFPQII